MSWYVVHTNPRQEATANHWLKRAGYETLYLYFQGTQSRAGKETKVILPYFPRYLFVAVGPSQGFYGLCTAIGVHSVVGMNGPEEVPAEVIEELRGRGNEHGFCVLTSEEKKLRKRLQNGTNVTYSYDAFTKLVGRVILDSGSAVSMWINGRKVTAPSHHVSPIVAER